MFKWGGFMKSIVFKSPVKHIFPAAIIICVLITFCTLFLGFYAGGRAQKAFAEDTSGSGYEKTVIIDPGHGGIDGGAIGVGGVVEKGINLDISLKLKVFFQQAGYRVIMTREDDRSIHDEDSDTIREKKTTDIHNRFKFMEENPKAIFISIHQNKYEQSQYSGTQVFYSVNNDNSKLLAQMIQTRVKKLLQPNNGREIKTAGDNLYLLYHAKSPAVLVECGFLSNSREAQLLQDPNYQNQMAFAIFCGTLDLYSGVENK